MKLRELLRHNDISHTVNYFCHLFSNYHTKEEMETKYTEENIRRIMTKMIDELVNLPSKESDLSLIAVVKYMDFNDDEFFYDYDDFVMKKGSNEFYGIEEIDWAEIIDVEVNDKSIEKYGITNVVNPILWSLSWNGYDYSTNTKNCKKFLEELDEAVQKAKDSDAVTYTVEEIGEKMAEEYDIREMEDEIREKSQKCLQFNRKEIREIGL